MSEPTKSETPRTDAAVNKGGNQLSNVVTESRRLETELNAANEKLHVARQAHISMCGQADKISARLDEAEKCLSFFASSIKCGSWWTEEHQSMLDSAMKGKTDANQ